MFCKTNGDKKSQELHLSTCIQLRVLKHPSRKVINFRHLLSCDTIVTYFKLHLPNLVKSHHLFEFNRRQTIIFEIKCLEMYE